RVREPLAARAQARLEARIDPPPGRRPRPRAPAEGHVAHGVAAQARARAAGEGARRLRAGEVGDREQGSALPRGLRPRGAAPRERDRSRERARAQGGARAAGGQMTEPRVADAGRFLNRELAWIAFNNRVLEEALEPSNPLLERVKFLSIVSSNL